MEEECELNTYASNVDGLPKTDFEAMRELASHIVDTRYSGAVTLYLSGSGQTVGTHVLQACATMEAMLARLNFNAFEHPEPDSPTTRWLQDMVLVLGMVCLLRSKIRQHDMKLQNVEMAYPQIQSAHEELRGLFAGLVSLAQLKDKEYGASWCRRGGIGAWFTTVRKFDRLVTQVSQKGNNIWDVSDEAGSTESLEETIKDGINYLLLILEKRQAIHNSRD